MLLYQGRDPSAACGEGHGKAAVSLQPMEVNDAAEMHLQSSEVPTPKKENASKKMLWPCGKTHTGAGSYQQTHGEYSPHWSRLAGRTCGGPLLEQSVSEGLQPMGKTYAGAACEKNISQRRDSMLEQGKSMKRKKQQTMYFELISTHNLHPPAPLEGRR